MKIEILTQFLFCREPHFKHKNQKSKSVCPSQANGTIRSQNQYVHSGNGKIQSQNQCPDRVIGTIHIKNQAYTDPWN
jgi:hypothetical protein